MKRVNSNMGDDGTRRVCRVLKNCFLIFTSGWVHLEVGENDPEVVEFPWGLAFGTHCPGISSHISEWKERLAKACVHLLSRVCYVWYVKKITLGREKIRHLQRGQRNGTRTRAGKSGMEDCMTSRVRNRN